MSDQNSNAYFQCRDSLLATLQQGYVSDPQGLLDMQNAMRALEPNHVAFGRDRYAYLRTLLSQVEQLPHHQSLVVQPTREQEPMFGHEYEHQMAPYRRVPFPYQLRKWDPAWVFVAFLTAGGFAFSLGGSGAGTLLYILAAFIAIMRVWIWCAYRFPLTTTFFSMVILNLMGGRRGRRW